jgi:LL-diaminopimelate aminotransferase
LNKLNATGFFKFFTSTHFDSTLLTDMIRINENYTKLKASYLFSDIAKRVAAYVAANPSKPVIRLGIGDVTEPLPPVCIEALHAATDELAKRATFKGYGPEQGYAFLREAVAQHDYAARGCQIEADEIFISDGSKCDCGNLQEIFAQDIRLAIPDPVYPVYVDTNAVSYTHLTLPTKLL